MALPVAGFVLHERERAAGKTRETVVLPKGLLPDSESTLGERKLGRAGALAARREVPVRAAEAFPGGIAACAQRHD